MVPHFFLNPICYLHSIYFFLLYSSLCSRIYALVINHYIPCINISYLKAALPQDSRAVDMSIPTPVSNTSHTTLDTISARHPDGSRCDSSGGLHQTKQLLDISVLPTIFMTNLHKSTMAREIRSGHPRPFSFYHQKQESVLQYAPQTS